LGISYKDAAHRLFLAEVERVQKAESARKSFVAIRQRLDNMVTTDIIAPIDAVDKGDLDGYQWKDGKWVNELKR
jgi:hypothetical protein